MSHHSIMYATSPFYYCTQLIWVMGHMEIGLAEFFESQEKKVAGKEPSGS